MRELHLLHGRAAGQHVRLHGRWRGHGGGGAVVVAVGALAAQHQRLAVLVALPAEATLLLVPVRDALLAALAELLAALAATTLRFLGF